MAGNSSSSRPSRSRPGHRSRSVILFDDDPEDSYSVHSQDSAHSAGSYQSQYSQHSRQSISSQHTRSSRVDEKDPAIGRGQLFQKILLLLFAIGFICAYGPAQFATASQIKEKKTEMKVHTNWKLAPSPIVEDEEDLESLESLASLGFTTIKASSHRPNISTKSESSTTRLRAAQDINILENLPLEFDEELKIQSTAEEGLTHVNARDPNETSGIPKVHKTMDTNQSISLGNMRATGDVENVVSSFAPPSTLQASSAVETSTLRFSNVNGPITHDASSTGQELTIDASSVDDSTSESAFVVELSSIDVGESSRGQQLIRPLSEDQTSQFRRRDVQSTNQVDKIQNPKGHTSEHLEMKNSIQHDNDKYMQGIRPWNEQLDDGEAIHSDSKEPSQQRRQQNQFQNPSGDNTTDDDQVNMRDSMVQPVSETLSFAPMLNRMSASSHIQSSVPFHLLGASLHISALPPLDFDLGRQGSSSAGRQPSEGSSHLLICQAILNRDNYDRDRETIFEHASICLDEHATANALAQIFLSSYLTRQGQQHGFNVDYRHDCMRHRPGISLIQELLPSPLHFPKYWFGHMGKESLVSFCQNVLQRSDEKNGASPIDIMQWETKFVERRRNLRVVLEGLGLLRRKLQMQRPMAIMELFLPIIKLNFQKASRRAREVQGVLKAGYGVLKQSPDVVGQSPRAVIILPCMDANCQDQYIVPYFDYLVHLPSSVQVVDLVITKNCNDNGSCQHYAFDFASSVRQFSPRAKVELIVANPSEADSFARLVEAEYVLCGPGWGLGCLFPALSRSAEHGRFILLEGDEQEHRGMLSKLPYQDLPPVHAARSRSLSVESIGAYNNRATEIAPFAQSSPQPSSGSCRFLRGKIGHWVQDMEYAATAQYRTPLRHYSGNAEKIFQKNLKKGKYGAMKYRPPTTYRWEETRYDKCQPSLMTRENVCDVLPAMGIQRIFILGDSLNLQMAQSVWMILTTNEAGSCPSPAGTNEPNFEAMITCPNGDQIKVVFVRNDELLENDLPVSMDEEKKNCHTYCYPWTEKYLYDNVRTVLFVNAGAHIHDFGLFSFMIDRFVTVFDGLNRPNDIVLFRTLVPGHWDCSRPGLTPFNSFDEYLKDTAAHQAPEVEAVYGWDMFTPYNNYVVNVLERRKSRPSSTAHALMEVVDIYPTTVLRPDGHCSDEYRPPNYLTTDCLHYALPGPVDWWNHLSFSHLVDIGRQQRSMHQETQSYQNSPKDTQKGEQLQNQYYVQEDHQQIENEHQGHSQNSEYEQESQKQGDHVRNQNYQTGLTQEVSQPQTNSYYQEYQQYQQPYQQEIEQTRSYSDQQGKWQQGGVPEQINNSQRPYPQQGKEQHTQNYQQQYPQQGGNQHTQNYQQQYPQQGGNQQNSWDMHGGNFLEQNNPNQYQDVRQSGQDQYQQGSHLQAHQTKSDDLQRVPRQGDQQDAHQYEHPHRGVQQQNLRYSLAPEQQGGQFYEDNYEQGNSQHQNLE